MYPFWLLSMVIYQYESTKILLEKMYKEKIERERKDKSREIHNHHPGISQQDLSVAI